MTVSRELGAVLDVPFESITRAESTLHHLSMTNVVNGYPPLETESALVWMELGCGAGQTALSVAASHPHTQVWGCDINPEHVESARWFARAARLDNIDFEMVPFSKVAADRDVGPPSADVIVVDSVYSWVSAATRSQIVDIIADRLAPGGTVYLSANAPAGWADLLALREVMMRLIELDPRPLGPSLRNAIEVLSDLERGGALSFPLGDVEASRLASFGQQSIGYLAHEFLNTAWDAMSTGRIVDDLERAQCQFVGLAHPVAHLAEFAVGAEQRELFRASEQVGLRESIRELSTSSGYRSLVFRRGRSHPTSVELRRWQEGLTIVGIDRGDVADLNAETPLGRTQLAPDAFGGLLDALERGPLRVADMVSVAPWETASLEQRLTAASMLVATGLALPGSSVPPTQRTIAAATRLNTVIADRVADGHDLRHLVAPTVGAGIHTDRSTILILRLLAAGVADRAALIEQTSKQLDQLSEVSRTGLDAGPPRGGTALDATVDDVLRRWPDAYRRLGIDLAANGTDG